MIRDTKVVLEEMQKYIMTYEDLACNLLNAPEGTVLYKYTVAHDGRQLDRSEIVIQRVVRHGKSNFIRLTTSDDSIRFIDPKEVNALYYTEPCYEGYFLGEEYANLSNAELYTYIQEAIQYAGIEQMWTYLSFML